MYFKALAFWILVAVLEFSEYLPYKMELLYIFKIMLVSLCDSSVFNRMIIRQEKVLFVIVTNDLPICHQLTFEMLVFISRIKLLLSISQYQMYLWIQNQLKNWTNDADFIQATGRITLQKHTIQRNLILFWRQRRSTMFRIMIKLSTSSRQSWNQLEYVIWAQNFTTLALVVVWDNLNRFFWMMEF